MNIKLLQKLGLLHTSPIESISYSYTTSPTDDLDIMRLLEGRADFYRLPKFAVEPKKKKIIITDPSLRYKLHGPGVVDITTHKALFNRLKAEGFEFSAWTGVLTPITNEEELSVVLSRIEPLHPLELSKRLAEKGIASDECYFYGLGKANALAKAILGTIQFPATVYLSVETLNLLPPKELDAFLTSIVGFPIVGLEFKRNAIDYVLQPNFLQYLNRHPLVDFTATDVTWQIIQDLCNKCPVLVTIGLSSCSGLGPCPKDFSLPKSLKTLDLSSTKITWNDIEKLIENCPLLESLNLSSCANLGAIPATLRLPKNLKSLNLRYTKITRNDLERLLENCPLLEDLDLLFCKDLDSCPRLPENLKLLSLDHGKFSLNEIEKLIENCPLLEALDLSLYKNVTKLRLPKNLKTLNLYETDVSWNDIEKLTVNCPLLESLNLSGCASLGSSPAKLRLPKNIKRLDLSFTNVTWDDIKKLVATCPLETLNLQGCYKLGSMPKNFTPPVTLNIIGLSTTANTTVSARNVSSDARPTSAKYSSEHAAPELDANTGPDKRNLSGQQVFFEKSRGNPDLSNYRKHIYNDVLINPQQIRPFDGKEAIVNHPIDTTPVNCDEIYQAKYVKDDKTFLGKITMLEGADDWFALPSLTPQDKLLHINTHPRIDFDIGYCKDKALYYLKPKQPLTQSITISYLIEADLNARNIKWALINRLIDTSSYTAVIKNLRLLPDGTLEDNSAKREFCQLSPVGQQQALIDYFRQATEKSIEIPNNSIDLINTIIREQAGVCRHRTTAYMALAKALNLRARAVENDLHMFVEVERENAWYSADLGGGAANITVAPLPTTVSASDIDKSAPPIKRPADERPTDIDKSAPPPIELAPTNRFRVWDTVSIKADTMDDYVSQLLQHAESLNPSKKNILSGLDRNQMESFATALLRQKKSRCYYLSDLNEVTDQAAVIHQSGTHTLEDSALATFIKNAKPGDVLLANWSDYEASHVGYNSMMDAKRSIKGIPIPEGVIVVGIVDRYQSMNEDFYSRFRVVSDCPEGLPTVSVLPTPVVPEPSARTIRFYDDRWRATLLGQPHAQKGKFSFVESDFVKAIQKSETPIVLKMAPWHLPEFRLFITELLLKRKFVVNGKEYTVPQDCKILRDDTPYLLEKGQHSSEPYTAKSDLTHAYVLNTMTLNTLFQRYTANDGQLSTLDGLIAEQQNKTLTLFVSESLSDAQWAHILDVAKQHQTKLHIIAGFDVSLPKEIQQDPLSAESLAPAQAQTSAWGWGAAVIGAAKRALTGLAASLVNEVPSAERLSSTQARLIETNDIDLTTAKLESLAPDTIVIPINPHTTYADLVGTNHVNKHPDGTFDMHYTQGELTTALLKNQSVVLKGQLSPALAQQLESLFSPKPYLQTNGQRIAPLPGKLTIVTNQTNVMTIVKHETQHFNPEESWQQLDKEFDSAYIKKLKTACMAFCQNTKEPPFGYIELKTMLNHSKRHPDSNPLKAILRAKTHYSDLKQPAEAAWKSVTGIRKPKHILPVIEKRIAKLTRLLNDDWYVFIAGSSGVGKSTTVQQTMKQMGYTPVDHPGSLKDKLKAWLQPGAKRALFLDEANLYERGAFDVLEGLYGKPPRLLIDGVYYPVPVDNRILFAGNFGHFKNRQQLNLIARHGQVITFKEFEDDFLHESIMRPVGKGLKLDETEKIENYFLNVYHHLNQCYPEKHPITARNLQMMVMRYALLKNKFQQQDALAMAAYDEASGVLNQPMRRDFASWLEQSQHVSVKQIKRSLKAEIDDKLTDAFHTTKKRKNPVRVLNNLMAVRERKIDNPSLATAGSGGLILEGNPGEGKSLLAIQYLQAQGFVNGKHASREEARQPNKRYYHLHTTNPDEIKRVLLKAFDEGAVVVIDEMNTLSLEHTLNALLSGTTPEGKPATHAGFFIIATQNPIHFGKRHVLSDAMLNRFQKLDLKDYAKEDLQIITTLMLGADKRDEAVQLVDEFLSAQAYARAKKIAREPTARDLFEKVEAMRSKAKDDLEIDLSGKTPQIKFSK